MKATVSDIIKIVDTIAPNSLAESWDNIGLQVGKRDWLVRKIQVSLDPLPEVVEAACKDKVDLLITHHPLIFKPLSALDFDTPVGSVLRMAVEHEMAIYSAHTNLDSAIGGINDILAERMALKNIRPLGEATGIPEQLKLVFYLPKGLERNVIPHLFETAATEYGMTAGRLIRMNGSTRQQKQSHLAEERTFKKTDGDGDLRIEVQIPKNKLDNILTRIKQQKVFSQLSYDVYPLLPVEVKAGLGRIGDLSKGSDLSEFAKRIKRKLHLSSVKIAGDPELPVYSVAVCSGSGSSLLIAFLASRAQAYVTGDLRYHDARIAESADRGLIDIGHFASEHLIVETLVDMLRNRISEAGFEVHIAASSLEKDPFVVI